MIRSEFILGGQKSGKSRRGELLAAAWLAHSPMHRAVLVATAHAHDDEMRRRIARHRADRAVRAPGLHTVEASMALAETIATYSAPDTLVVVDCLTLWLTQLLMPIERVSDPALSFDEPAVNNAVTLLLDAVRNARGPIVLVGNEIGLGVIPLGREVRAFVDALGQLNQGMATVCDRVTLMVAGLSLTLKESA
jgi:adenosylcobinamide kinase/adenosylcobinamide-phosphate guanylyltransferase